MFVNNFPRAIFMFFVLCQAALGSFVLVPLYVYPGDAAFQSYLNSFGANPTVNFKVVINPNNGPGSSVYPEDIYIAAIAKLKTYTNVQILGYVHTTTALRPITGVIADIAVYANWKSYPTGNLSVSGIFFDEAPNRWTALTSVYMTTAVNTAKTSFTSPYIVFNPGTTVDSQFYGIADNILAWENAYWTFSTAALAAIPAQFASKSSVMFHDFTGSAADQASVVKALSNYNVGGIFITDSFSYSTISSFWTPFCKAIAG